ncbi:hypothetical protein MNBD_GAMMA09-775 [hydrothermal vent metagenome]|uniref:Outer membrane protein assembly factor BamE domain-containing protein n=1 Tax=hydrothermal vent metagenome TaxID=652676 RepID=A0A3B0Y930_9ZZZZ
MQKNLITICLLTGFFFIFTGCEPHRIDIQQGNKVDPEVYEQLKKGMTRKQIVFLLGTPLLKDAFHQDRWDYIYYLKPGNEDVKQSRVTLYFKGDSLVKIDGSAYAPEVHQHMKQSEFSEDGSKPAPRGAGGGHSH